MSINSFIGKLYKFIKINYWKIIKILLIIIISLSLIYLLERYILYNIIYYPLLFISNILHLQKYNIFSLKFETIFLLIYLHLLLIRIVILSIIFIQGGLFKKILVYDQFHSFISIINDYANHAIENLSDNNQDNFEFFMDKLDIFRRSYKNIINRKIKLKMLDSNLENDIEDVFKNFNNFKAEQSEEIEENLIESLKIFSNDIIKFPIFSLFEKIFKFEYNNSLMLMEEFMLNSFQTHSVEKRNISKNFDIYLLAPKNPNENNNILTIFCNQNAISCEFYSIGKDNIYYYLNELNCNIILWNYKGFGLRGGITTFGNIDKDVEILSNYIKNNFSKYKIIIHGCSIGGYSSIKLTQKICQFNNAVLISDRTFGDIKNIVQSLNYSEILTLIYNIIFPQWYFKYRNVENYIDIPYDKKLILFDEYDEIIQYNPASLVFNITKKYYSEIVKPKISEYNKYFSIIKNSPKLNDKMHQLAIDYNNEKFDKNGRIFIQHLNYYINSIDLFFMFFIVFGYPFNRFKEINLNSNNLIKEYMKIPFIFKKIIQNNEMIDKEISDIISAFNFMFIKINLNCKINDNDIFTMNYDDKNDFTIKENDMNKLKNYFGNIHRIHCGHNGKLENKDYNVIKDFLKGNKFI